MLDLRNPKTRAAISDALKTGAITEADLAEYKHAKKHLGQTSWRVPEVKAAREAVLRSRSASLRSKVFGMAADTSETKRDVKTVLQRVDNIERMVKDLHTVQVRGQLTDGHERLTLAEIRAQCRSSKNAMTTVLDAARLREAAEKEDVAVLKLARQQRAQDDPESIIKDTAPVKMFRCGFKAPGATRGCQRKVRVQGKTCEFCRPTNQLAPAASSSSSPDDVDAPVAVVLAPQAL